MREQYRGLTAAEASQRLRKEGPNELPRAAPRSALRIIMDVLREPMFALLLAGGVVYLMLGDLQEAVVLSLFATFSISIAVGQDLRSERVLEALRTLASPRALVVRDGKRVRIPGREVVRGDIILVSEGDRIAADAVVRETTDLRIDESALTGESVPVAKTATATALDAMPSPGGDDMPAIFAGTLVVGGQGLAEVIATGHRSQIGAVGASLADISTERPRLEREMRGIVRIWAIAGVVASLGVIALYGLLRGGWLDALLAGIATGMSMLPEELPLVLTVFMVMGAWRMSRKNVLTRRAPAIELLGSANLLCTDKTGTLTQNKMRISRLCAGNETLHVLPDTASLPPSFAELVREGLLACPRSTQDPMELAFYALSQSAASSGDHPGNPVRSYPLRPGLMAMSQAWPQPDGTTYVAAKGAVEAIILLCRLEGEQAAAIRHRTDEMARDGVRVLGVARAVLEAGKPLPDDHTELVFSYTGLVGLSDPLREEVPDAVKECRSAGIRVVMITGDYPATASAIAAQAGIRPAPVLRGEDIAAMDDGALAAALRNTDVCARIAPLQKLRIVRAFQSNGDIIAMTGDGVNDAPSLKAANIGIAMGNRGTDVAREAAALVLLDDDFASIVHAIRLGRRIYDNLRKAISYIMAIHIPIAGLALLPLMFGLPVLFFPVHIAFLEMIIDPICSIAFEAEREERDVMRRPPRPHNQRLFTNNMIVRAVMQGFTVLVFVMALYALALHNGASDGTARAMAFTALVTANAGLIFLNRSFQTSIRAALFRGNKILLAVFVVITAALTLVLAWAPARALFQFAAVDASSLAQAIGTGVAAFAVLNAAQWLLRRSPPGAS